jgi:hypothetical protein
MTFNDREGRVWDVRLDLGLCLKLRNLHRIDLLDETKAGEITALLIDRERLGNVLWLFVGDQAAAVGITKDQFFSALDADALTAGWGALADAFTDFCPSPTREAVRAAIAKQTEAMERAAVELVKVINGPEADAAVTTAIRSAMKEATTAIQAVGA